MEWHITLGNLNVDSTKDMVTNNTTKGIRLTDNKWTTCVACATSKAKRAGPSKNPTAKPTSQG